MNETMIVVVCAVAGSFCGQLAANLLFPAVTLAEKRSQLAWMKCQEEMNDELWKRQDGLERTLVASESSRREGKK